MTHSNTILSARFSDVTAWMQRHSFPKSNCAKTEIAGTKSNIIIIIIFFKRISRFNWILRTCLHFPLLPTLGIENKLFTITYDLIPPMLPSSVHVSNESESERQDPVCDSHRVTQS